MKITSLVLDIEEQQFDLYESELLNQGWEKVPGQHVYQKRYGDMEIRERLASFSGEFTLKLVAHNKKGIAPDRIYALLEELASADKTEDEE
jgi:hypothetical protein